jgi:hypothetical protein
MKKIKGGFFILLTCAALVALAEKVVDINSSVGNGNAMKTNLNEPNCTSPARFNIQGYERDGIVKNMNNHPDEDLANHYNRTLYEGKK